MRPFFIGLSVALGFSINPMVLAQNAGPELQGLIRNFQLTRGDISRVIDLLLSAEKISQTQAHEAKARLKDMTDQEIKGLSMTALTNVHSGDGLFADEKASEKSNKESTKEFQRSPASVTPKLPSSPFFSRQEISFETLDERKERERLEEIQKNIHKNFFSKKKFQ